MGVGCFWPEVGVGDIIVLRQMFLIFFIPTTSLDQCPLSMHLMYANSEHWLSGGNITHSFLHAARLFCCINSAWPKDYALLSGSRQQIKYDKYARGEAKEMGAAHCFIRYCNISLVVL